MLTGTLVCMLMGIFSATPIYVEQTIGGKINVKNKVVKLLEKLQLTAALCNEI